MVYHVSKVETDSFGLLSSQIHIFYINMDAAMDEMKGGRYIEQTTI